MSYKDKLKPISTPIAPAATTGAAPSYASKLKPLTSESTPERPDATAGHSTGLMGGPLSLLAVPGQLAAKAVLKVGQNAPMKEVVKTTDQARAKQGELLKEMEAEPDPVKKRALFDKSEIFHKAVSDISKDASELEQSNLEAQRVDTPIGDLPALSDKPGRITQQVLGRGVKTAGMVASGLGGAASGAAYGLGEAMEEDASLADTAKKTAAYAAGGKFFGFLGKTGVGQKVLSTKPFQVLGKLIKPLMTSAAAPGTAGAAVDAAAAKVGEVVDRAFSPSTYLHGGAKALEAAGLRAGPAERLAAAEEKLAAKYRDAINLNQRQTQMEYKTKKDIGEILVREEVPLKSYKEAGKIKLDTTEAQAALQAKAKVQNTAFEGVLKDSGEYVNFDSYAAATRNAIARNFDGAERIAANAHFDKEVLAWKSQLAGGSITGQDGSMLVPAYKFNRLKQYFWTTTPGMKTPEALLSDSVNGLAGSEAKQAIQAAVQDANIQAMNQYLGDLAYAQKILMTKNGSVVPGGAMGKYFARTVGAIAGSSGGVLGSVGGAMTADKVAEAMMRPEFTAGRQAALVAELRKQLGAQADDVVNQAYQIIEQRAAQRAATMRLPSRTGVIELPGAKPPTTFEPQAPASSYAKPTTEEPLRMLKAPPKGGVSTINQGRPLVTKAPTTYEAPAKKIVPPSKSKVIPLISSKTPKSMNITATAKEMAEMAEQPLGASPAYSKKPFSSASPHSSIRYDASDIKEVPLKSLDNSNGKYKLDTKVARRVIDKYKEQMLSGVKITPVEVSVNAKGELSLGDGYHRVQAAKELGYDKIAAVSKVSLWKGLDSTKLRPFRPAVAGEYDSLLGEKVKYGGKAMQINSVNGEYAYVGPLRADGNPNVRVPVSKLLGENPSLARFTRIKK